jgi:hypothetical protein
MQNEQRKSGYDTLKWGFYITKEVIYQLEAFNDSKHITGKRLVLNGRYIILDNSQVYNLILTIVRPESEPEWLRDFDGLVTFPHTQPGFKIDVSKWQWMFAALLQYQYNFKRVLRFLDSGKDFHFRPPLKSKMNYNRKGLMQLWYEKIPQGLGLKLHLMIPEWQVKQCDTIEEYLTLFMQISQTLYDHSKQASIYKLKVESTFLHVDGGDMNPKPGEYSKPKSLSFLNSVNVSGNDMLPYPENPHEFNYYDAFIDEPNHNCGGMNPMYNNDDIYSGG